LDQLTRERTRASYEVIRAELPDNGFRSTYRRLDKPLKGLLEHAAVAARADTNAGYGDARLAEVLAGYDGLSHVVAELEWLCARFPRPD
jgi:creatinine amidohydrolase/Fe(II)-dependent formamide hydrolase-like protein